MGISFNSIPNSIRVPFVGVEIDNSRATSGAALAYRALLIGQKTSAGAGVANTIVKVTSANQVLALAGRGSELHRMAIAWFTSNRSTDLYVGILVDDGSGVAATKTITLTGPATAAGTLNVYIGGVFVPVAVASGAANTAVATALAAAVTANLDLPVTAGAAGAVVTLTARNKGVAGQNLDVRVNYQIDEATPAGIGATVANAVSGVTNPVLSTLIAAMADNWYQVIAHPYTDATSLSAIEAELASRFGPMRMIDGVAVTASVGTNGTLSTLGNTRNSPHSVIMASPGKNPVTPPAEFAAETAALIALSASIDPARPFQTLAYTHSKGPIEGDLFTRDERNLALYAGIGSTLLAAGGVVRLERPITTYKTNASGAADESYLDVTTMLTLMELRYSWATRIPLRYPRHKLADDTFIPSAGQAVVTPKIIKAEAVAWFSEQMERGLVENLEAFKAAIVVERNALNRNRIDVLLPPDLINQLMVTATKMQFVL